MDWRIGLGAIATLLVVVGGSADADSVYSFGDSLSDSGNVRSLTFGAAGGGDQYWKGRFSNGENWVDVLSLEIAGEYQRTNPGLIGPNFRGMRDGYNFAHGGAVSNYDNLNAEDALGFRPPSTVLRVADPFVLLGQARHFRDQKRPLAGRVFRAGGDDFATISVGGNDYLNGATDINAVTESIVKSMDMIRDRGVVNFVVLDLPTLGEVPARINGDERQALNAISIAHNQSLSASIETFEERRGAQVAIISLSRIYAEIVRDADENRGAEFGFTIVRPAENTRGNCLDDGLVLDACPDSYLFYDGLHPTRAAHELIGKIALANILSDSADETDLSDRTAQAANLRNDLARIVTARIGAAWLSPQSGWLTDWAGDATIAGGLGFIAAEQSGPPRQSGLSVYAYQSGRVVSENDPGSAPTVGRSSLSVRSDGAMTVYGADGRATRDLFVGAAFMAEEGRATPGFQTEVRSSSLQALYAAWRSARNLNLDLRFTAGDVVRTVERSTGFDRSPLAVSVQASRFDTLRLDVRRSATIRSVTARGVFRAAHTRMRHEGYRENARLDIVARDVASRRFEGSAFFLGGGLEAGFRPSEMTRGSLSYEGGLMGATSDRLGLSSLIDQPDIGKLRRSRSSLFAQSVSQDRLAVQSSLQVRLSHRNGITVGAGVSALVSKTGVRSAANIRGVWRF